MSNLNSDWWEYNHDYRKQVQDIRLRNGEEIMACWPNAGTWAPVLPSSEHHGREIPDEDVTHTRLSKGWNESQYYDLH